jgi:hypothetical protein
LKCVAGVALSEIRLQSPALSKQPLLYHRRNCLAASQAGVCRFSVFTPRKIGLSPDIPARAVLPPKPETDFRAGRA